MCVLMSTTLLVQNTLRSGKCSACTAQKATEAHLELWLIVSDLNGKEIGGWTFYEHLPNVKFHDIRSVLLILAHAYIERYVLALQIVANGLSYEYKVVLIDTMLVGSAIKFPQFVKKLLWQTGTKK